MMLSKKSVQCERPLAVQILHGQFLITSIIRNVDYAVLVHSALWIPMIWSMAYNLQHHEDKMERFETLIAP